jgi:hypothetical protein
MKKLIFITTLLLFTFSACSHRENSKSAGFPPYGGYTPQTFDLPNFWRIF